MQDIFEFERTGISPRGKVLGRFRATGASAASAWTAEGLRHPSFGVDFPRGARGEGKVDGAVLPGRFPDLHGRAVRGGLLRVVRAAAGRAWMRWRRGCASCARNTRSAARGRRRICAPRAARAVRVPGRLRRRGSACCGGCRSMIDQADLKYRAADVFGLSARARRRRVSCCFGLVGDCGPADPAAGDCRVPDRRRADRSTSCKCARSG